MIIHWDYVLGGYSVIGANAIVWTNAGAIGGLGAPKNFQGFIRNVGRLGKH